MMGAILTIEGINIFSPYLDTKFSPQYSPYFLKSKSLKLALR